LECFMNEWYCTEESFENKLFFDLIMRFDDQVG